VQFGAPVVGKPYSAKRIYDYEPAKDSTDLVAVHSEVKYFRDSAGRTRSEFVRPDRPAAIEVVDVVAHWRYLWTAGDSVASREEITEAQPQASISEKLDAHAPSIEGVPTRYSHSVSGKDKVEKSVESWYSPDLKLAILTIIDEPGIGKKTYHFVNLSQAEPDPALFRVPEGFTLVDSNRTPPPPVQAKRGPSSPEKPASAKLSLPNEIADDNYLEALARFHAAVPRWLPLDSSYHRRTEVRLIDIFGKESIAIVDQWQKGKLGRDEERAPGWHYMTVWGPEQHWSTHEGIDALHLSDIPDLSPRPGPAERRIRIYAEGYVALKRHEIDGAVLGCSGKYAGAELCFNTATGFPVSAAVDGELIVYEQWAQFNGANYPSRFALYRNRRLQMEATTTMTPLDDSSDALFQPLPGIAPSPNRVPAYREDRHRILSRGQIYNSAYGEALVKVYVDTSGRVRRAELLDADDKSLIKAAISAAKSTVYMPEEANGHKVPFETTFWMCNWSTVDPLRVVATSSKSQGPD
jgi:hypothetical protein